MFANVAWGGTGGDETAGRLQNSVSVAARSLTDVVAVGEAVPLVLAIANHGAGRVYSLLTESDFREGFCTVKDANGTVISGGPIAEPNVPLPSYWYMEKDGRRVLTMPLYEIAAKGVRLLVIADAVRRHHGRMAEGIYFLSLGDIEILHDVEDVIVREGLPFRLWVEAEAQMTRVRHPVNDVKIEIRKPQGQETRPPRAPEQVLWVWRSFLAGAVVGAGVLVVLVMVKKKAAGSGSRQ
jgi:hypothetical protein